MMAAERKVWWEIKRKVHADTFTSLVSQAASLHVKQTRRSAQVSEAEELKLCSEITEND